MKREYFNTEQKLVDQLLRAYRLGKCAIDRHQLWFATIVLISLIIALLWFPACQRLEYFGVLVVVLSTGCAGVAAYFISNLQKVLDCADPQVGFTTIPVQALKSVSNPAPEYLGRVRRVSLAKKLGNKMRPKVRDTLVQLLIIESMLLCFGSFFSGFGEFLSKNLMLCGDWTC